MRLFSIFLVVVLTGGVSTKLFSGEETREYKVTGLDCEMCPKMVKKAVEKIEGVKKVEVTLIGGKVENGATVKVTADFSKVTDEQIQTAVHKADKNFQCERVTPKAQ